MARDTLAVLFNDVERVGFGPVQVPEPGPGDIVVRTDYTLISPGTELRCLAGKQINTLGWPYVPGYALVGEVIESHGAMPVGTKILCGGTHDVIGAYKMWGGHIGLAVLPETMAYPIPEGTDLVSAAVARLAAISHRGPIVSEARPGETVAVVGLGAIGQLSARIFKAKGCEVIAIDTALERVKLARMGGIEAEVVLDDIPSTVRRRFPEGADIVVDATGVPALFDQSMLAGRDLPWGEPDQRPCRIVVQGSYPEGFPVEYDPGFRREASIVFPRDSRPSDLRACIDLVAEGKISTRELVGEILSPVMAPSAYARLQNDRSVCTIAFDWSLVR